MKKIFLPVLVIVIVAITGMIIFKATDDKTQTASVYSIPSKNTSDPLSLKTDNLTVIGRKDMCSNLSGLQLNIPNGYQASGSGNCTCLDGYISISSTNTPGVFSCVPKPSLQNVCSKNAFTMAIIFVTTPLSAADQVRYADELNYVKNRFPWAFSYATNGLATMSIPDSPAFLDPSGLILPGGSLDLSATLRKFYQSSPDKFDFVTVFSSVGNTNTDYYHANAQNNIKGIGLGIFNIASNYGSAGKLLGVNYMNDMLDRNGSVKSCYVQQQNNLTSLSIETDIDCGMAGILHETGHQWAAYFGDMVSGSSPNTVNLGIRKDFAHYYFGLMSTPGTQDLNGSGYWKKSDDNTVFINDTSDENSIVEKYHPFTLYAMGVLPAIEYDTKFNILQDGGQYSPSPNWTFQSMASVYKQVSVRDIIAKEGKRTCQLK